VSSQTDLQAECDTYQCNFDSADCTYTTSLYGECSAIPFDILCYDLFNNSVCDRACNSAECLFDGWDCEDNESRSCNPMYDAYCIEHYADGHCDQGCNVAECQWDGLDCVTEKHFARGIIIIVVAVPLSKFATVRTVFGREIGSLLHTVVVVTRESADDDNSNLYDSIFCFQY